MNRLAGLQLLVVVVAVAAAAACGPVTVSGKFGDRELNVGGTAVGWIDETEYVQDGGGGTPVLQDRTTDAVLMHLMFTEAVFDPRVDMRSLPAGERDAIVSDIERGDRLFVDIRRGNVIRAGDDKIELVKNDGSLPPEVLPFITKIAIQLGDPVISQNDRYPDRVAQVGTRMSAKLVVDKVSPELVAKLHIDALRADGETDGFLEGRVDVQFALELLPERLAECNFAPGDAGVVDACDLGAAGGGLAAGGR